MCIRDRDQKVNSYCGTENGLYQIKSFERDEYGEVIGIEAWKFKKAENFFKTPINSSDVGIYKCSDLSPNICSLKQIDITAKYYGIPKPANDNKMILVQLLHAFWQKLNTRILIMAGFHLSVLYLKKNREYACVH